MPEFSSGTSIIICAGARHVERVDDALLSWRVPRCAAHARLELTGNEEAWIYILRHLPESDGWLKIMKAARNFRAAIRESVKILPANLDHPGAMRQQIAHRHPPGYVRLKVDKFMEIIGNRNVESKFIVVDHRSCQRFGKSHPPRPAA